MQYRLKFVSKADHDRAWNDIESWGYPWGRNDYGEVAMVEVGTSAAWIWFEWLTHDVVVVHLAANSEHRRRWFTRHVRDGLRWAAEFMGAKRIYTLADESQDVIAYVKRLGWKQDKIGWYTDV